MKKIKNKILMNMKTGGNIEQMVADLVRLSDVNATGGVYVAGMRPADSMNEDLVVSFVDGQFTADGMLVGEISVDAFVRDVMDDGGAFQRNHSRTLQLEEDLAVWANEVGVVGDGLFVISNMAKTVRSEVIGWHVVNVRLKFKFIN